MADDVCDAVDALQGVDTVHGEMTFQELGVRALLAIREQRSTP